MRPLHAEVGEEHAGIEHREHHVHREDHREGGERALHDAALVADLVDGGAGGHGVVRADEVAEGGTGVLPGEDGDGVHAEGVCGLNVHIGEHDVRADARAGDG